MNEMCLKFLSRSENEIFARNVVAAFALPLGPTLAELSDVKTAVSEAVTNCIVHGYRDSEGWITLVCKTEGTSLHIEISDSGKGIDDLEKALNPFTRRCRTRSAREWGLRSCRRLCPIFPSNLRRARERRCA